MNIIINLDFEAFAELNDHDKARVKRLEKLNGRDAFQRDHLFEKLEMNKSSLGRVMKIFVITLGGKKEWWFEYSKTEAAERALRADARITGVIYK